MSTHESSARRSHDQPLTEALELARQVDSILSTAENAADHDTRSRVRIARALALGLVDHLSDLADRSETGTYRIARHEEESLR